MLMCLSIARQFNDWLNTHDLYFVNPMLAGTKCNFCYSKKNFCNNHFNYFTAAIHMVTYTSRFS